MRSGLSTSPRSVSPLVSRIARSACLLGLLLPSPRATRFPAMNPFEKNETYKPEIIPQVPADKLYNDGLALLEKNEYDAAAKKFADLDKQYPFSSLVEEGAAAADLRPVHRPQFRRRDRLRKALPGAEPDDRRRRLRRLHGGDVLLQPDP